MRGVSLIEVLIAIAISLLILVGVFNTIKSSGEIFWNQKILSDLIENARNTEIQLRFYFSRWGFGMQEDPSSDSCEFVFSKTLSETKFPRNRFCLMIDNGTPCDRITFYGNTGGYAIVLDEKDENYFYAHRCRIKKYSNPNKRYYYYIWRKDKVLALTDGKKLSNAGLESGGNCGLDGDFKNGKIKKKVKDIYGVSVNLQPSDAIISVPEIIRLYCRQKDGTLYLYVSEKEGDKRAISYPLTPVKEFKAYPLPEGCSYLNGTCVGIKLHIKFFIKEGRYEDELERILIFRR